MKTFNSITLIFSLQTLVFIISISSSHAITFNQNSETLITFTCSKTPYPNLCLESLTSHLGSDRADMWGLAGIMLNNVLDVKAEKVLDLIYAVQDNIPESYQCLASCASKYVTILDVDIPKAKAAFHKENPKDAEDAANAVAYEASTCEDSFPGYITGENKIVHHVAANTAAIFKLLHS